MEPLNNALAALPNGGMAADQVLPLTLRLITRRQSTGTTPSAWDHTQRLFPLLGAKPGSLYLVRPDGHVLARWQQGEASAVLRAIDHALHLPQPALLYWPSPMWAIQRWPSNG